MFRLQIPTIFWNQIRRCLLSTQHNIEVVQWEFEIWPFKNRKHILVILYTMGAMVVWYSDRLLVNGSIYKPPFDYRPAIQIPSINIQGIWIINHLSNEQVKVCYSDVSAFQMLAIQTTVKRKNVFIYKTVYASQKSGFQMVGTFQNSDISSFRIPNTRSFITKRSQAY